MSPRTIRFLVSVTIGAVAALSVLIINSSWLTPGVNGDSVAYMTAAESLAKDGTLRIPVSSWASADSTATLAHFPPGFSVAMAVPIKAFGVRAEVAALWTVAASVGLVLGMVVWIASAYAGLAAGVLSALLLFGTPGWTKIHLSVWSEPLYVAITLVMLYVMLKLPKRPLVYGTLAALGLAVRYVGVAGTAAAAIWSMRQGKTWRERIAGATLATAPSLIFLVWWKTYVSTNGGTIREMGVYGDILFPLEQIPGALVEWLVPAGVGGIINTQIAALLLFGVVVALIALATKTRFWVDGPRRDLATAIGIYVIMYLGVVVASRMFLDPRIPFNYRIFMPVFVLTTMIFAMSLKSVLSRGRPPLRATVTTLIALWSILAFTEIRAGVASINENGAFYTYTGWISDPAIDWVDNRSTLYSTLYSNEPALIYYQTMRNAKQLPDKGEDLQAFRAAFAERPGAIIVAFPLHTGNFTETSWLRLLDLEVAVRSDNAVVYVPTKGY